jgi:hypothetical protein
LQAVQAGGRFDETTGEPESWQTPLRNVRVHEWSRRWLAEQWQEWQPRTRALVSEALGRFSFDQMLGAYDTFGCAAETRP